MSIYQFKIPLEVKGYIGAKIEADSEEEAIAKFWAEEMWEAIFDKPCTLTITDVDPKTIQDLELLLIE